MVDQYDEKTPVDGDPEDAPQGLPKVDPDAPPAKPNAEEPVEQEQPDKDQGDPLGGAKGGGTMNVARTDNATQPVDSDRERASRGLSHAVATAGLTLGEYAERAAAVEQAATVDEIEAAVRGLPEESAGVAPARLGRWIVAVLGGTEQRGRWRLSKRLWLVAAAGGATLDLSAAQPEAPESIITVIAILGGAELILPQGVSVQLSGFALLGGKGDQRAGGSPLPGSPLIRVRAFTFLGGVSIKEPKMRRNLLDVIRSRREKPPT